MKAGRMLCGGVRPPRKPTNLFRAFHAAGTTAERDQIVIDLVLHAAAGLDPFHDPTPAQDVVSTGRIKAAPAARARARYGTGLARTPTDDEKSPEAVSGTTTAGGRDDRYTSRRETVAPAIDAAPLRGTPMGHSRWHDIGAGHHR